MNIFSKFHRGHFAVCIMGSFSHSYHISYTFLRNTVLNSFKYYDLKHNMVYYIIFLHWISYNVRKNVNVLRQKGRFTSTLKTAIRRIIRAWVPQARMSTDI